MHQQFTFTDYGDEGCAVLYHLPTELRSLANLLLISKREREREREEFIVDYSVGKPCLIFVLQFQWARSVYLGRRGGGRRGEQRSKVLDLCPFRPDFFFKSVSCVDSSRDAGARFANWDFETKVRKKGTIADIQIMLQNIGWWGRQRETN